MKSISLGVLESDYEAFRDASRQSDRSIAQLIREAMALYREERLTPRTALREIPVLAGHRPVGDLPRRSEIYGEIFDDPEPNNPKPVGE